MTLLFIENPKKYMSGRWFPAMIFHNLSSSRRIIQTFSYFCVSCLTFFLRLFLQPQQHLRLHMFQSYFANDWEIRLVILLYSRSLNNYHFIQCHYVVTLIRIYQFLSQTTVCVEFACMSFLLAFWFSLISQRCAHQVNWCV